MNKEQFIEECKKININLTNEQLNKLENFYIFMTEYNKKTNLTRITDEKEVYLKHFYDSLTINKVINLKNYVSLCDVGTGAGFPGIVLKIVFPNLSITLIESSNKKCTYLTQLIEKLNLKNISVVCDRSENYSKKIRDKYDIVASRAVANLKVLSELCIPLVKKDGYFIALKSKADEEIKNSQDILNQLNSKIENVCSFNLPYENSLRNIIVIKKEKITDLKYPRNYKDIIKK
jgi:16S rRNA (guanine527-N7)-methyltransferase